MCDGCVCVCASLCNVLFEFDITDYSIGSHSAIDKKRNAVATERQTSKLGKHEMHTNNYKPTNTNSGVSAQIATIFKAFQCVTCFPVPVQFLY